MILFSIPIKKKKKIESVLTTLYKLWFYFFSLLTFLHSYFESVKKKQMVKFSGYFTSMSLFLSYLNTLFNNETE